MINPEQLLPCRVTLTLQQQATLREAAAREGTSVSALVRRAIDGFIAPVPSATQETRHV